MVLCAAERSGIKCPFVEDNFDHVGHKEELEADKRNVVCTFVVNEEE